MKKLFHHTNKSGNQWEDWDSMEEGYDEEYEEDQDIDEEFEEEEDFYFAEKSEEDEDFYFAEKSEEDEDAYYAEESEEDEDAYYAEESEEDEDAYYAEESEEDEDAYYAEESEEGEDAYYAEESEEDEDAYYAEESEEDEDAYYAEESEEDEDVYYAEDESEEDEDAYYMEEHSRWEKSGGSGGNRNQRSKGGFLQKLQRGISSMTAMDRVIVCTGIGVLILALVTGGIFVSSRMVEDQISDFVSVGSQLDGITVIGEQGLLAVADAQLAKAAAAAIIEDEDENQEDYNEADYAREVTVKMEMTSIQRDLKIKFINKKTEKLVANVPFAVTVTGPDKKSVIWSDDDMDGIIYKKDIEPGDYTVVMEALTDEKYADYSISTDKQNAKVKKDINYEKVDVANEVKKESEVNAKKEDTKINETTVESTLQDTVAWVESKVIASAYNEISKSDIPDPMTIAMSKGFMRMTEETSNPSEGAGTESSEPSTEPTQPTTEPTTEPTQEPSTEPTTTPTPEPTESPSPSPSESPDLSGSPSPSPTATPTVTPTPLPVKLTDIKLTANQAVLPVSVGGKATAQIAAEYTTKVQDKEKDVAVKLKYAATTDNAAIATATVSEAGVVTITGVKAGTAKITVTAEYDPPKVEGVTIETGKAGTVTIAVTVANKVITLDKTAVTVYMGTPVTINAALANISVADPTVVAESSDTTVATVAVNKKAVTITGVKAGTATITVKYVDPSSKEELKATCAVTVKANPKEDKTTSLKDKNGNLIYVLENGNYREAKYADYYTASKFFLKGNARYTGWQTLDGKVYFFDANGNKVTGEQVIQGAKYNFASDGSLVTGNGALGIDVSKWNGTIDWAAVKNSGINYVIIRCGYRGSSQGKLIEDPKFTANIKGATAAGLKVGVYFFTQAIDEREAVEEASMVLEQVKNYKISYPIFLDVEASGGRADGISKETRTAVCKAFCATIQSAGYNAGIYANKNWLETKLDPSALSAYKIWLAQYAAAPTYKGRYDLWQYRSTGSVSGISGNVDLNLSYLGY